MAIPPVSAVLRLPSPTKYVKYVTYFVGPRRSTCWGDTVLELLPLDEDPTSTARRSGPKTEPPCEPGITEISTEASGSG
jgi:hypothetical protein